MKSVNIKHISNLHTDALRGLDFYEQELNILQERLEEIAGKNSAHEVLAEVEHFQNQFIIHRNEFISLRHALRQNQKKIGTEVLHLAGFADTCDIENNESLYEQYLEEEKLFGEMRHEFNRFAAKWM